MPQRHFSRFVLFAVPVLALLAMAKFANTSPPTNSARTEPDAPPELRTRIYRGNLGDVEIQVRKIAAEQTKYGSTWRVMPPENAGEGAQITRVVKVEVPVLIFTDDLIITLKQRGNTNQTESAQIQLDIESRSRVGKGDFGENRRHLLQLLSALDAQLKPAN